MGLTTKRNRLTVFQFKMLFLKKKIALIALIGLALSDSSSDYGSDYDEVPGNNNTGKCVFLLRKKEPLYKCERITFFIISETL